MCSGDDLLRIVEAGDCLSKWKCIALKVVVSRFLSLHHRIEFSLMLVAMRFFGLVIEEDLAMRIYSPRRPSSVLKPCYVLAVEDVWVGCHCQYLTLIFLIYM